MQAQEELARRAMTYTDKTVKGGCTVASMHFQALFSVEIVNLPAHPLVLRHRQRRLAVYPKIECRTPECHSKA